MLHDTVIMSGYPHTLSADELKAKLPDKHQKGIEKVSSSLCCRDLGLQISFYLTFYLLLTSADNLCKQFAPRSSQTKHWA